MDSNALVQKAKAGILTKEEQHELIEAMNRDLADLKRTDPEGYAAILAQFAGVAASITQALEAD